MTNGMCGIETTTISAVLPFAPRGYSIGTWGVRRISPLQGGADLVATLSQGVALGCRVAAPLARNIRPAKPMERINGSQFGAWPFGSQSIAQPEGSPTAAQPEGSPPCAQPEGSPPCAQPEGLKPISPGQRPGTSSTNPFISPEWASPAHAQARDLEARIAENVTTLLETD